MLDAVCVVCLWIISVWFLGQKECSPSFTLGLSYLWIGWNRSTQIIRRFPEALGIAKRKNFVVVAPVFFFFGFTFLLLLVSSLQPILISFLFFCTRHSFSSRQNNKILHILHYILVLRKLTHVQKYNLHDADWLIEKKDGMQVFECVIPSSS